MWRWIVTAGHCHDSNLVIDVAVLGEHDVDVETETMIKIVIHAGMVIKHVYTKNLGKKHHFQSPS